MDHKREKCPCCGYPTLDLRSHPSMPTFDICILCSWQDDGQTDIDADRVYGGPNGKYSLTEAQENFKKYLVKYSPDNDTRMAHDDYQRELAAKKELIDLYEDLKQSHNNANDEIWAKIFNVENELNDFVSKRINQFIENKE